ncbi:Zn-ribbon domain-containing OB-fold protein [Amycolatopsis acidicola]|uniref:Zn-ribbon domain-containing OB-fold protein n=1 Tax=Amycolatopsis acidicola TaxID=2596893 RepID=UPI00140D565B|nr:Zn-ribbon domain-containing OB-fold protein [Amycolatopsis acidicola]
MTNADVIANRIDSRPRPEPNEVTAPYFAACARGELLIQRCPDCGHAQHYPRALCTSCGAAPDWERSSGQGTVYTFTVIRQTGVAPFREEVPYVVAMIELAEGPRLMGNVTGVDPEAVRIGMPVEVYMVQVDDEVGVPYWRAR